MSPPTKVQKTGVCRWMICGLLFLSVAINYIDRLVIGILKKPISTELGWTDQDYGYIAGFFSFAYAFGYLIGGRTIDRLGVKRGLSLFVFFWSLAAMAHGFVSFIGKTEQFRMHYPWFSFGEGGLVWMTFAMPMTAAGFLTARVALGLTEGANFPAAIKTVAEWFPVKERALATGWFNAGTNVGAILCPICVPWMYFHIGWASTFYVTGGCGFLWLIAWWFAYDEPDRHPRLSTAELRYIRSGQPAVEKTGSSVPWRSLLRHRPVWAYVLASILAGPAWGFYQFFIPDFLEKRFHLGLQETGWWTGAFFALAGAGGVLGGWVASSLLGRGWTLDRSRKAALLLCALCVTPVFFASLAGAVWLSVLIVGLAGAAHQGWSANLYSVVSDTMPKAAISSVIGLGGFVAFITGGFINSFTGMILQRTGSYICVFAYFSGAYLLALLAVQLLIPKIPETAASAPEESADLIGELTEG